MEKKIPAKVIKEAESLINMYWENIRYLGTNKDYEYYQFIFPENAETGFPFVYIYSPQDWEVLEVTGFRALDIIGEFSKE